MVLPVIGSLITGSVIIIANGKNPFITYWNLFEAGFTCHSGIGRCALMTTLQFATPLILSGLSAAVALRAGFFSIGQAGQMLFGAAAAVWVGANLELTGSFLPIIALACAGILGGLWGLIPAFLRNYLGVNEIISTLLLNPIAGFLIGFFKLGQLSKNARLLPLVASTKINSGFILALLLVLVVYLYLWKMKAGFEIRSSAQAPRFAHYGGIQRNQPILVAMVISGALAGLAGGIEVLGVHYKFVSSFSAVNDFDGLIIAFAGHLHPAGVLLFSFLVGGLRAGSIVGLQIRSGIPRELGGALIALILIFAAMHKVYQLKQGYQPRTGGNRKSG